MRKMLRDVVAEARARLAVTLRALAASGLAEQESGKRFAAPRWVGWGFGVVEGGCNTYSGLRHLVWRSRLEGV